MRPLPGLLLLFLRRPNALPRWLLLPLELCSRHAVSCRHILFRGSRQLPALPQRSLMSERHIGLAECLAVRERLAHHVTLCIAKRAGLRDIRVAIYRRVCARLAYHGAKRADAQRARFAIDHGVCTRLAHDSAQLRRHVLRLAVRGAQPVGRPFLHRLNERRGVVQSQQRVCEPIALAPARGLVAGGHAQPQRLGLAQRQ